MRRSFFRDVLQAQPKRIGALNPLTLALMNMECFAEAEAFNAKTVWLTLLGGVAANLLDAPSDSPRRSKPNEQLVVELGAEPGKTSDDNAQAS
jgi:hypothetical protein